MNSNIAPRTVGLLPKMIIIEISFVGLCVTCEILLLLNLYWQADNQKREEDTR